MKTQSQFLLKVLISAIVINKAIAQSCNNPFTRRFKNSIEKVAKETPLADKKDGTKESFQYCKDEFGSYGTCCNEEKMNELANLRIYKWAKAYNNFAQSIEKAKNIFEANRWKIVARLVRLYEWVDKVEIDDLSSVVKETLKNYIKKPPGSKTKTRYDLDLLFFIEDGQRFKKGYDLYLKQSASCFKNTYFFLRSMFCFSCSARVKDLMDGNRLKIHVSTCRTVVKSCIGPWTFVYNMMHIAKAYTLFSEVKRKVGTPEAAKIKIRKDTMGPDTTFESGVLSFYMREIYELANDDNILFYFTDDIKVCNRLVTVNEGNEDTTGDLNLIEEFEKEMNAATDYDKELDAKQGPELRKEFHQMNAKTEKDLENTLSGYKKTYEAVKSSYEKFMDVDMKQYISQIYDFSQELSDKKKPVSDERKKVIEVKMGEIKKEFTTKRINLKNRSLKIKEVVQTKVYNTFTYRIDEKVKRPFIDMYTNLIVISGKMSILKLPEPQVGLNENLMSKEKFVMSGLEKVRKNLSLESWEEVRQMEERILQDGENEAKSVVSVSDNSEGNAGLMFEGDEVLPGPEGLKLTIKKFQALRSIFVMGLFGIFALIGR